MIGSPESDVSMRGRSDLIYANIYKRNVTTPKQPSISMLTHNRTFVIFSAITLTVNIQYIYIDQTKHDYVNSVDESPSSSVHHPIRPDIFSSRINFQIHIYPHCKQKCFEN